MSPEHEPDLLQRMLDLQMDTNNWPTWKDHGPVTRTCLLYCGIHIFLSLDVKGPQGNGNAAGCRLFEEQVLHEPSFTPETSASFGEYYHTSHFAHMTFLCWPCLVKAWVLRPAMSVSGRNIEKKLATSVPSSVQQNNIMLGILNLNFYFLGFCFFIYLFLDWKFRYHFGLAQRFHWCSYIGHWSHTILYGSFQTIPAILGVCLCAGRAWDTFAPNSTHSIMCLGSWHWALQKWKHYFPPL